MTLTTPCSPPRGRFHSRATPTAPIRSITAIITTSGPPSIFRRCVRSPTATSARSPMMPRPMRPPTPTIGKTCMPAMASSRPAMASGGYWQGCASSRLTPDMAATCTTPTTDINTPTAVKTSYTNFFPTLQGRYDILDNLIARATYASGIARPGFDQIDPGATVSVINARGHGGQPRLETHHRPEFRFDPGILSRRRPDRRGRAVLQGFQELHSAVAAVRR